MVISNKEFGKLIKEARKIKSEKINGLFTQTDLAKSLNKSRGYIGDIETGRTFPNYKLLKEIATACDVDINFFNVYIDNAVENQLKEYPEDTVNQIKEVVKNDYSTELQFLSGSKKDKINLYGYFTKADYDSDTVSAKMPRHRRLRLLMDHKKLDVFELATLAKVDYKDVVYLCGGFILNNDKNRDISEETLYKIAKVLDTSVDFINCNTNNKWSYTTESKSFILKEAEAEYKTKTDSPMDLIKNLLKNPVIKESLNINSDSISDNDLNEYANELYNHIKLLSYKYDRKI